MQRNLRYDGETDEQFANRADSAAELARRLIDGALENYFIQDFIEDPDLPYSAEMERSNPTVRIEYEQAYAIGGIGETLAATRNKHWGDGPVISPLHPSDQVDPMRILYFFREGSLYNQRYEQRQRMKKLLGRKHRSLVTSAKYKRNSFEAFRAQVTSEQEEYISKELGLTLKQFWRAAKGKVLFEKLPLKERQLRLKLWDDE